MKNLREDSGLSQLALSKKVGISQSAIARYELNKTEPKVSDVRKLALFFHVSADFLLMLSDD